MKKNIPTTRHMLLISLLCATSGLLSAQHTVGRPIGVEDMVRWRRINSPVLSPDGSWAAWTLRPEEGDDILQVWSSATGLASDYPRGSAPVFSQDGRYLVFRIQPPADTVREQRRRKVKKEDLPKDSLGILSLVEGTLEKVPGIKTFAVPDKWSGWVVMHKEAEQALVVEKERDSTVSVVPDTVAQMATSEVPARPAVRKKAKKENRENGTRLVMRELATGWEEVVPYVLDYRLAEAGQRLLLTSTGNDSTLSEGAYLYDFGQRELRPMWRQRGKYRQLSMDEQGGQAALLACFDTTGAQVPVYGLLYWREGMDSARVLADTGAAFLAAGWLVSEHTRPEFSQDGGKLYFGVAPPPLVADTNLLPEEVVQVEVWHTSDVLLHTQQKVLVERERKRSFDVVWWVAEDRFVPLADAGMPEIRYETDRNADLAVGYTEEPYGRLISWEGTVRRDIWALDLRTGGRTEVAKGVRGTPRISPGGTYIYWYSEPDSAWFTYHAPTEALRQVTENTAHPFYDERNDVPDYPNPYGVAAWEEGDRYLLIYDRYDIWRVDPAGKEKASNLTLGRSGRTVYRYIRLDPEERYVRPGQRMFLRIFDEGTKDSGYGFLLLGAGKPIQVVGGAYDYSPRPTKAREADKLLFTRENFRTFPDLLHSDFTFQDIRRASDANPQQAEHRWGTIELYTWTSLTGEEMTGLLVKPDGFDPRKKYPMVVNFYERSSDGLHDYRMPVPGRSSINYSHYASKGYLIFNPDITYKDGYPGESCLNTVVSGVVSLIDKGFVDRNRIGLQGHSWGGYQGAYLLTRTDLFRCAEIGAPVVNMYSAYGGIRWETGLTRQFQYEHTQSRIGGSIWEYPMRYYENSPLFSLDRMDTPVLIMHNDSDGHVPWYQGIEYFVALRRLGKPAWMLNYNGEPHWPLKLQNRKDFQVRMSQFFDHYLQDAPLPRWMERGVPAVEKGILQGLELSADE
jgi:dipeptidyl aminopeptidase/acylaminoacyl peptidase